MARTLLQFCTPWPLVKWRSLTRTSSVCLLVRLARARICGSNVYVFGGSAWPRTRAVAWRGRGCGRALCRWETRVDAPSPAAWRRRWRLSLLARLCFALFVACVRARKPCCLRCGAVRRGCGVLAVQRVVFTWRVRGARWSVLQRSSARTHQVMVMARSHRR